MEVLRHSKSSEISRKQLDASLVANAALTDELAETRDSQLRIEAQASTALHDRHVSHEAALGAREQEAEASRVAAEVLERQRAKALEDQTRYRELETQHQQLLVQTRKKAAEETARRASAERRVKEMSDEMSRRREADAQRESADDDKLAKLSRADALDARVL